jgi:ribosomal protein L11 methylase PrmA
VERIQPQTVWDLGANTGLYSRIASSRGIETIAFDLDPGSVERNYRTVREQKESHLLPLLMDLTNPSPAIGWANAERMSLAQRGPADLALALALVHHLAIGNNLPFDYIAGFLRQVCQALVVEFVPKSDGQVQQLLRSRKDIFPDYSEAAFVRHFSTYFRVIETVPLCDSERKLYLMVQE